MTDFLVTVAEGDEARRARAAGADLLGCRGGVRAIVAAADGARVIAFVETLELGRERLSEGAAMAAIAVASHGAAQRAQIAAAAPLNAVGPAAIVVLADRADPLDALAPIAAAGFSGVFLEPAAAGARLLACLDIGAIAAFVEEAHRAGLTCGLSGRLQAPDIPRLLALGPDSLGFRSALCAQGGHGGLDSAAVAAFRRLIPRGASVAPASTSGVDRVFVRDFTIEAQIGAYAHERDHRQRVRFNVEADVRRRPRADDDFETLFSYDVITDAIRRFAGGRHIVLVETLAERIAEATLRDAHVLRVRVRVEKLDVIDGAVGVEIVRERA